MMRILRTLDDAVNSARSDRSRFTQTVVAIALSVAFLTATLVLSDSATGTAAADIANAHAGVDYVIEGETVAEGDGGPGEALEMVKAELDVGLPSRLAAHPDIVDAVGVEEGFAKLVADGVAIGDGTAIDVGRTWIDNPKLSTFELAEGSAPSGLSEIAIDLAVARDGGLAVGDTVQVVTATGLHDLSISGLARFGGAERAPQQRTVLFSSTGATEFLEIDGFDEVLVESRADAMTVSAAVRSLESTAVVVPVDEAVTAKQNAVTTPFSFLASFLLAFAVLAALVGATIIYNTFVIAMAHRRRELAMRRAIGATRRMVRAGVLVEAAIVAAAATGIGIGIGVLGVGAVRRLMTALGVPFIDGPTIFTGETLAIAASIGVTVALASAWRPAARASLVAPVEALREAATESADARPRRTVLGVALLVAGALGLVMAALIGDVRALFVGTLVVPGLVIAGPSLVGAVSQFANYPLGKMLGWVGSMVATDLRRHPKRSASTSLGLTLGVAMVGFFAIIASSLTANLTTTLVDRLAVDQVVASVAPGYSTVDPGLADRIRDIEDVETVGAIAIVDAGVGGSEAVIGGIDDAVPALFDFAVTEGSLTGLEDGGVAVWAGIESGPPSIGETLTISLPSGELSAPVVALFSESLSGFDPPTHLVARPVLTSIESGLLDDTLFLTVETEQAAARVQDAVASTPGSLLQSKSEYVASASTGVDSIRNLVFAMLGLTVLIAIIGVANTTVLTMSERVREIGMLRAIGATQRDVRRIVRWQAAILAAIGTTLGLAISILGAWALIGAVGGSDLTIVAIPWGLFAVVAGGAVLSALVSVSAPAWPISRRPTLDALNA